MNKLKKIIQLAKAYRKKPIAKVRLTLTGELVNVYGKPAKAWKEGEPVVVYSNSSTVWTARNMQAHPKENGIVIIDTLRPNHPGRFQKIIARQAVVIEKL